MRHRTRLPSRLGFTLVELMVAMALIIFIMYILAEAFSAGAKTFRDLKAVGDMNTRLRTATTAIRRLLAADHFEGHKRLSDPNFWEDGPPKSGFFRLWQDDDGVNEGVDLDSEGPANIQNLSYRTATHHLHFTVRYRGNQRGDYFSAQVPSTSPLISLPQPDSRFQDGSNQFTSPWAEVAIYLLPTGESTNDPNATSGSPVPLHTLFLRQRLLAPGVDEISSSSLPAYTDASGYTEVSATRSPPDNRTNTSATKMWFNSPQDVTMPIRRFGPRYWNNFPTNSNQVDDNVPTLAGARPPGRSGLRYKPDNQNAYPLSSYPTLADENLGLEGSDVLLTDVLSFDVRVLLGREAYDVAGIPERFVSLHEKSRPNDTSPSPNPLVTAPYWMVETNPTRPLNLDLARIQTSTGQQNSFRVFDTWSQRKDDQYDYTGWAPPAPVNGVRNGTGQTIPMYQNDNSVTRPIRIRAIKVTIRIWDHRTKQSRQVSVIQDM